MSEVIIILSGKGGTGKTTAAVNIGTALASKNKKVLIMDFDTGLRSLDIAAGIEQRVINTLSDVIDGNCKLRQAIIKDTSFEELHFLAASQIKDQTSISKEQLQALLEKIEPEYDYILIDCPPGIGQGMRTAAAVADRSILVITPDVLSVRTADKIAMLLRDDYQDKSHHPMLLINHYKADLIERKLQMSIEDIHEILPLELLGVIPEDEDIYAGIISGTPVAQAKSSISGKVFCNIAARLTGENVPIMEFHQKKGFFSKLFSK